MSLIEATRFAEACFPGIPIGEAIQCVSCKDTHPEWIEQAEFRACYNNAANILIDSQIMGPKDIKYVLGVSVHYLPVDHAWVKVGDTYYDPTRERWDAIDPYYFPIYELNIGQLHKLVIANEMCPPALYQMKKLLTLVDL